MAGRVKLARFLEKNNTVLPVYVEGCLKPYAEMLATHVSAFETLQDQLNLLSSESFNSVISPSGQHQAMTWAKKLRGHMAWVKHKAYDARVRMIKAQNPTEAGLRYLADKNGFAFEVTKIRARVPLLPPHITRQQREMGIFSADYLDEYQISFADGSPSWYAHFHYRHIGATLTEYSAAYLKNDAQRCLGHAWELDAVKQGRDVELYRGRISEELAQRLFFTKHTHNSRA